MFASGLDRIVDLLAPQPGEQALDVACGAVVREMVRVVRPGGRTGVTDLVLDGADPGLVDRNTHLERLRDPSHGRTLSTDEIHGLLLDAGATPVSTDHRDNPLDVEDWMARSHTPETDREDIRQ